VSGSQRVTKDGCKDDERKREKKKHVVPYEKKKHVVPYDDDDDGR